MREDHGSHDEPGAANFARAHSTWTPEQPSASDLAQDVRDDALAARHRRPFEGFPALVAGLEAAVRGEVA